METNAATARYEMSARLQSGNILPVVSPAPAQSVLDAKANPAILMLKRRIALGVAGYAPTSPRT
ncbi:MAG: hypothetical protein LBU39_04920 [Desulfobulbaceae bacterium]|nr:hypothetical protein [Desulfobulbaceae bacterium]